MVSTKITIHGEKVQQVGYRLFLLEKALESGFERIYIKNLDADKVVILLSDKEEEEERINSFYQVVSKERPKDALVKDVKSEPYEGKIPTLPIDRYIQYLNLEQLIKGREDIAALPALVGYAVKAVAPSIEGIDGKINNAIGRFDVFSQSATRMDGKLTNIEAQLKSIDTKMDKLATTPDKLDELPGKIAEALNPATSDKITKPDH